MQDQSTSQASISTAPSLLCFPPDVSLLPSSHTQLQASPVQDGTHRVRAELSGSAASGAQPHPKGFSLVLKSLSVLSWLGSGDVPKGDSPAGEPEEGLAGL